MTAKRVTNEKVAETLERLALLLEYREGKTETVRDLFFAREVTHSFDFPLALFSDNDSLRGIKSAFFPRFATRSFSIFQEVVQSGSAALLEELTREISPETETLIRFPQMGPERAARLRDVLGIVTVEDLWRKGKERQVRQVDGIGSRLEKSWLEEIELRASREKKRERKGALFLSWTIAEILIDYFSEQIQKKVTGSIPVRETPFFRLARQLQSSDHEPIKDWDKKPENGTADEGERHSADIAFNPASASTDFENGDPPDRNDGKNRVAPLYRPSDGWGSPNRPIRRPLPFLEKLRAFFRRETPDYNDPRFFDPLGNDLSEEVPATESETKRPELTLFTSPNETDDSVGEGEKSRESGGGETERKKISAPNESDAWPKSVSKNDAEGEMSRPFPQNADADSPESPQRPLLADLAAVGDFRRLIEKVDQFEFLVATDDISPLFDALITLPFITGEFQQDGRTLTLGLEKTRLQIPRVRQIPNLPIQIHACSPAAFTTEQIRLASSAAHWEQLVRRAEERGFSLNEFGLWRKGKGKIPWEPVPSATEDSFYASLDLPAIPPEVRDHLFEFDPDRFRPEALIRSEDIRGDLHLHTTYSDGTGSVEEMVAAAHARGLSYIALTDHSQRVYSAGGMDARQVGEYWKKIDQVNERLRRDGDSFRVLKGIEVDVLANGDLDLDDDVLAQADWVVASLHFDLDQSREEIHHRLFRALSNPYVCVMAHPTGKTAWTDFRIDLDRNYLFETAKKYGKALELNSQPRRLDLDWRSCLAARKIGVPIVISTDSHTPDEMAYLRYGINMARKAGLTPNDVLNTKTLEELLAARTAMLDQGEWRLFDRHLD